MSSANYCQVVCGRCSRPMDLNTSINRGVNQLSICPTCDAVEIKIKQLPDTLLCQIEMINGRWCWYESFDPEVEKKYNKFTHHEAYLDISRLAAEVLDLHGMRLTLDPYHPTDNFCHGIISLLEPVIEAEFTVLTTSTDDGWNTESGTDHICTVEEIQERNFYLEKMLKQAEEELSRLGYQYQGDKLVPPGRAIYDQSPRVG